MAQPSLAVIHHATMQYMFSSPGDMEDPGVDPQVSREEEDNERMESVADARESEGKVTRGGVTKRMNIFSVLSGAVDHLKLWEGDKKATPQAKRAALFPVLSPLHSFASAERAFNVPCVFKRHLENIIADQRQDEGYKEELAYGGEFASFASTTGHPAQSYATAYVRAGTPFSRFLKYLKKRGWVGRPEEEINLYLAHPMFRLNALELYLQGKQLPILELDCLKQWSLHTGVPVPDNAPSWATAANGIKQDGEVDDIRPDGILLSRQQVVDRHLALLPDIISHLNELSVKDDPPAKDVWKALKALWAVASLRGDTGVLAMAGEVWPGAYEFFYRISVTSDETEANKHAVYRQFFVHQRNNGFAPCIVDEMDKMLDTNQDITPILPVNGEALSLSRQGASDARELRSFVESASQLANAANILHLRTGLGVGSDVSITDPLPVQSMLSAMKMTWNRHQIGRLLRLAACQNFNVGARSSIDLSKGARDKDLDDVRNSLRTDEVKSERDMMSWLEALKHIAESHLMKAPATGDTESSGDSSADELLASSVEALNKAQATITEIQDSFCIPEQLENSRHPDNSASVKDGSYGVYLQKEVADTLPEKPSDWVEDDDTIDTIQIEANRVGRWIKTLHHDAYHLVSLIIDESEQYQASMRQAAKEFQTQTAGAGQAFAAIDAQMAKLNAAREDYAAWVDDMREQLDAIMVSFREFNQAEIVRVDFTSLFEEPEEEAASAHEQEIAEIQASHEEAVHGLKEAISEKDQEIARLQEALDAQRRKKEQAQHEAGSLEQQVKSLKHHLSGAERQRMDAEVVEGEHGFESVAEALIEFSESPTPERALVLTQALYPGRMTILDSAYASAREASEMSANGLLRRLLVLAQKGHDIMATEGKAIYDLRHVMPGTLACSESETCLSIPKMRKERIFEEKLADGGNREWLMTTHNYISHEHRMYFDYDADRERFVVGHAGRHLSIPSVA